MLFDSDTYKTIQSASEGLSRDRGSKFIGYAYPLQNEKEVKEYIFQLKKAHPTASHWCYAYFIGPNHEGFRSSDDGEPSGSAGKPILNQLKSFGITNVLVVVVRYFGGSLLGVPGLINAYKEATKLALQNAKIIEKQVMEYYHISFEYILTNEVMKIIKQFDLVLLDKQMELICKYTIAVRKSNADKVIELFNKLDRIRLTYLKTN
jgi:uncharacterized YigZ family protein